MDYHKTEGVTINIIWNSPFSYKVDGFLLMDARKLTFSFKSIIIIIKII